MAQGISDGSRVSEIVVINRRAVAERIGDGKRIAKNTVVGCTGCYRIRRAAELRPVLLGNRGGISVQVVAVGSDPVKLVGHGVGQIVRGVAVSGRFLFWFPECECVAGCASKLIEIQL